MSDWKLLNEHRVSLKEDPIWGSNRGDGFNGMFICRVNGLQLLIVASDGLGWQHVSVSVRGSVIPPSWSMMCQVKDLFWEPEDLVMQIHPPRSVYVNQHPGCLHLWKPTKPGVMIPLPDPIMVGTQFENGKPTLTPP